MSHPLHIPARGQRVLQGFNYVFGAFAILVAIASLIIPYPSDGPLSIAALIVMCALPFLALNSLLLMIAGWRKGLFGWIAILAFVLSCIFGKGLYMS